ncbi:Malectin-like domain [Dillenia turbinata]|uniref:Malectin-like domain n=1 Tax=Dillenia turbinata TaxID=194707 RepID=A0AAN8VKX4_9MAGN
MILTLDLQDGTPQAAFLAFYFTESTASCDPDDIRIIDIHINGQIMKTVSLDLAKCTVITLYPISVVGPTINITLGPNQKSTLPPLIGAMEAFTRKDVQETSGSGGGGGGGRHWIISSLYIAF